MNVKKIIETIFDINENKLEEWMNGQIKLDSLLNLSVSEDATIVHFIVPLLKHLGYSAKEIDIKPFLHINYGRKVVKKGGEGDVIVRKGKSPAFVIEAKAYGHSLQSKTEDAEGQAYDYTRANELKPSPKYY